MQVDTSKHSYALARLPLSAITLSPRHRRDLGDLDALAASIRAVGLLHPLVIAPDGHLIAGERRLRAVQRLGWSEVPVHVVHGLDDALLALRAQRDENCCRLPFALSEAVALGRELEQLERQAARARQQAGRRRGGQLRNGTGPNSVETFHQAGGQEEKGKTRDKVGAALGMSGKSYEKARAVVEAAEEDAEEFRALVEEMDRTRKVNRVYQVLEQRRLAKERAAQGQQVMGEMGVINADFREGGSAVEDATADLILTDPRYEGASVPLYADLARFAARVLRPGGLCLAYWGGAYLPEVLAGMAAHLDYSGFLLSTTLSGVMES